MCETKKVFIASPSDLGDLRQKIAEEINDFDCMNSTVIFRAESSETTPGAAGNPQLNIDESVRNSNYVIVLFKNQWGSRPGKTLWEFSSGTEEELFVGLAGLLDSSSPICDVLVVFLETRGARIDSRITDLKKRIQDNHVLQYKVATKDAEVLSIIRLNLANWQTDGAHKQNRIALLPASGKDVLQVCERLQNGRYHIERGETQRANAELLYSATYGGPNEKLEYAHFLFSQGHYKHAVEFNKSAIQQAEQYPDSTDPLIKSRAYSYLAHIDRRNNDPDSAINWLNQALRIFPQQLDNAAKEKKAEVYDALGLSYHALHSDRNEQDSIDNFKYALNLRKNLGKNELLLKSYINLSREYMSLDRSGKAKDYLNRAEKIVNKVADQKDSANFYLLRAQFRKSRQQNFSRIYADAKKSLQINSRINNIGGQASANYVIAEAYLMDGNVKHALDHAYDCMKLNENAENTQGIIKTYRLFGNIYLENGDYDKAIDSFTKEIKKHSDNYIQNFLFYGWALAKLAEAYILKGDYESGKENFNKAQEINKKENDKRLTDYLGAVKSELENCK